MSRPDSACDVLSSHIAPSLHKSVISQHNHTVASILLSFAFSYMNFNVVIFCIILFDS